MLSLIAFATHWGSKYGGINSFNTDFLTAFGNTYRNEVQVICIVSSATVDEIAQAKENHVTLVTDVTQSLSFATQHKPVELP